MKTAGGAGVRAVEDFQTISRARITPSKPATNTHSVNVAALLAGRAFMSQWFGFWFQEGTALSAHRGLREPCRDGCPRWFSGDVPENDEAAPVGVEGVASSTPGNGPGE